MHRASGAILHMLTAILMPLLAAAAFLSFGMYWLSHTKKTPEVSCPKALRFLFPKDGKLTRGALVRLTAETAGAEIVLFAVLWAVIRFGMYAPGGMLPAWALLVTAAVPFAALFAHCFRQKNARAGRLLLHLSVWLAVLLTAEVLLCNAKSFTTEQKAYDLAAGEILPQAENAAETADGYVITGDTEFLLTGIPEGTHGILLHMEQENNPQKTAARLVRVWLDMKDGNFRYSFIQTGDRLTMAFDRDTAFSIDPYGKPEALLLHFSMITEPVTLRGVTAVSALPFAFSGLRWLLLALGGLLLLGILDFRLWEITYTRTKAQCLAVAAVTALCTASAFCFWDPGQEMVKYNSSGSYSNTDPYIMTFDAFQKGQVYLDIEADPGLASLENVYDVSERNQSGLPYRWDMAYKDGKYYSYFGVTPILVLYYPCYLLTGKLPTVPIAVDVFATLSALLICLTVLAAVRLTVKRPNFLMLLLSLPAAVAGGAVYTCLQYDDKYYEAVSCGMCFLLLTLWLGLWGCSVKRFGGRCALFCLCGASLALCAGARPTMAVSAAILLPFFLGILLRRSEKLSGRLIQAGCFAAPLLCGVIGLMAYNNARFSSPLDFGSAYQLTVSDTHANTLRLSLLPAAWKHYLLQAPVPRTTFPFFEPVNSSLRNYGRYLYTDATYGVLALPSVLLGTLLLPLGLRRERMQTTRGITLMQKRAALVLCFAVPALLAWVDFCMGGVNQRYVTDIMPLFTIGSLLVLQRTADVKQHRYRYGVALVSLAATVGMIWLLMIGLRDCALLRNCPTLYDTFEDALIIWN